MGASQSGMNMILGEEDLEDVEGYVTRRQEVPVQIAEAEHIIQIQTDLGLNFATSDTTMVPRLMGLEDRDRKEVEDQEAQPDQCY
jgi:hypothetical protein